ncbi:MAG: hypothetical protein AAFW69_08335, partial [Pseudomonadota bacterium]
VAWTNTDVVPHTATAGDGSWDTGALSRGEAGEVTFAVEGRFDYLCAFHPMMTGRIVVLG